MPIPRAKVRGFEVCKGFEDKDITLPTKATQHAAGYDFQVAEDVTILPFSTTNPKPTFVPTGVKAYMRYSEMLLLFARSSLAKSGLQLANSVGVTDADYTDNEVNDGHIQFIVWNYSDTPINLKKAERIGQGVFVAYLTADNGGSKVKRTGGFGSTNI